MMKFLLRFCLLLMLCSLLVYAPEILTAVSAPYVCAAPQRVLLRVAMLCSGETSEQINPVINDYQKQYPQVHLRVISIGDKWLIHAPPPYPDVVLCCVSPGAQLPAGYLLSSTIPCDGFTLQCAVLSSSGQLQTAEVFAAYINEALSVHTAPP